MAAFNFRPILASILLAWAGSSWAQTAPWRAETSLSLGQTFTDNAGMAGSGGARSDWITEVTPGIKITGRSARAAGDANLRIQNFVSARHGEDNRTSIGLAANGSFEAVENHVFIYSNASINRQEISSFGAPTSQAGNYSSNANMTEVRTVSIAPRAHFNFSSDTALDLNYRANLSETDAAALSHSNTNSWGATLSSDVSAARLSWIVSANGSSTDSESSQSVSSESVKGGLNYVVSPEWRVQTTVGHETNDYRGDRQESSPTWGGGFDWTPGPRTKLGVSVAHRYFGTGYAVSFTHRMPLSAIQLRASRDVQSSTAEGASGITMQSYSTRFATEYLLEDANLRAAISDPALRNAQVLQNLAARGVTPTVTQLNYVSSGYTINKQISLGWVYSGVRNSVSVTFASNRRDRTDSTNLQGLGDFSTFSRITDDSLTATYNHRLSAFSTVGLSLSHINTKGSGGSPSQSRILNGLGLTLATKLGPRTSSQLAYHRTRSTGSSSTRENAISASLAHQF